jgi:hypothetical protein
MVTMPYMIEAFQRVIEGGFQTIQQLYADIGRKI